MIRTHLLSEAMEEGFDEEFMDWRDFNLAAAQYLLTTSESHPSKKKKKKIT